MSDNNESREKLLLCAKEEFLEKGFTKASLRSICAKAGLTTGAVYFLFKDKNGLLKAIVEQPLNKLFELMQIHFKMEQQEDLSTYHQRDGDHDAFALDLVELLYGNYDAMMILLDKSQGSDYDGLVDKIIFMIDGYYRTFAKQYADITPGKVVDEYMLHWFSHLQVEAFIHLLTHEPDKEKAKVSIKRIIDCLVSSWMNYILKDEA